MSFLPRRPMWRFDEFELLAGAELRRGGQPVALGRRALDVLTALVAEQGRLVTREDLQRAVWPHAVVVDNALPQQVRALRLALGDRADLIENVARQGYRFAGCAEPVDVGAAGDSEVREFASAAPEASHLPAALTELIGREDALACLLELWSQQRFLTLLGAGGIGKTRLALALAHAVRAEGAAVTWVDLTGLGAEADVEAAIGAALGLRGDSPEAPLARVVRALRGAPRRLVLDNCEHLADRCAAAVFFLLQQVPSLHVLVTSQRALAAPGEYRWRVPPLGLPSEALGAPLAEAAALRLLRQRIGEAAGRPVALQGRALADAAALCRRLEGNPLAIELVAVRAASLGLSATLAAVADRDQLLRDARVNGPHKQRSLQAALEWSYALLPPGLQALWRRLSVFHGGFTLPAAEAVLGLAGAGEVGDGTVLLAGLSELVDRSLVEADPDEPRFRLLDVQRTFGDIELRRHGEHEDHARGHAQYLAALFEHAAAQWDRSADQDWLDAHAAETDNLRAAIRHTLAHGDRGLAARLVAASTPLWRALGIPHELRHLLDHPLLQPHAPPGVDEAGLDLARASSLLVDAADKSQLRLAATRAVQSCGAAGDRLSLAQALLCLALAHARSGDFGAQGQVLERTQPLLDAHRHGKTWGWYCDARAWWEQMGGGGLAGALHWAQAAAQAYRDCGASQGEAQALLHVADLQLGLGDCEAAIANGDFLMCELDHRYPREWRGRALANLGAACWLAGHRERAGRLLVQALEELRGLDFSYWVFDHLAPLALAKGRADLAARMVGHADAGYARQRGGLRLHNEAAAQRQTLDDLQACLSPASLASLRATGAADSEDELRACFCRLSNSCDPIVVAWGPAGPATPDLTCAERHVQDPDRATRGAADIRRQSRYDDA